MKTQFWPLLLDTLRALGKQYYPAMDDVADKAGIDRGSGGILLSVLSFDPEPVSNEILQKRIPYQAYSTRLEEAVNLGLLMPLGSGLYRLTEKGQMIGQQIILAAYARMEYLEPMRTSDLHYLTVLLRQLVKASHTSPDPPGKWSITHSRRFDPGESAPLLIQIDQYLSDLAAYRDDAHLAAWQPLGFDGPTWETLSLLWREAPLTVDDLHEKLKHRQHTLATYEQALHTLEEQGYAQSESGTYSLTPEGTQLRQKAEDDTDQYYYAPWDCLTKEDLEALENLLKMLIDGLS